LYFNKLFHEAARRGGYFHSISIVFPFIISRSAAKSISIVFQWSFFFLSRKRIIQMLILGFYGFQVKKVLPEFRFRKGGAKE
jgi:hypothetical protein